MTSIQNDKKKKKSYIFLNLCIIYNNQTLVARYKQSDIVFFSFLLLSGRKSATAAAAAVAIKQLCPSGQPPLFAIFLPPLQISRLTSPRTPCQTGCCCQQASPPYRRSINTPPPLLDSPPTPYHQPKVPCIQIAVRYGRVGVLVLVLCGGVLTVGNQNL